MQETFALLLLYLQFSSDDCGIKKSCLREPANCDPQNDALCYFLSFKTEDESVVFELSGPAPGYISFALSTDKWMVVIMCAFYPSVI